MKKPSIWLLLIGSVLPIILIMIDYSFQLNQIIIPDNIDPTLLALIYDGLIAFGAVFNAIFWGILYFNQNTFKLYRAYFSIDFLSGLTIGILLFCGLAQLTGLPYLVYSALLSLYTEGIYAYPEPTWFLALFLISLSIILAILLPYIMLVVTIFLRILTKKKLEKFQERQTLFFWLGIIIPFISISVYYVYLDYQTLQG